MKSLPFSEVDSILRQMESRHNLLDYRLGHWSIWAVLRWPVAMRIANLNLSGKARLGHLVRLRLIVSDLLRLLFLPRACLLVECYSSALLEQKGNAFKDIWFDDVLGCAESYVKIEHVNSPAFLERRKQTLLPSHLSTTLLDTTASMLARLYAPRSARRLAISIHEVIRKELGKKALSQREIEIALAVFVYRKTFWRWLIRHVSPYAILVADPGNFSLAAAARECGIPVIEFQHGIMDRFNPAYSWPQSALRYRDCLPIPNYLFLHGEHWKRELDTIGFWKETARVTGNARVDQYRAIRSTRRANGPFRILFTSQGIAQIQVAEMLGGLMQAVTDKDTLELVVKLHPIFDQCKEPFVKHLAGDSRVRIYRGDEGASTFELLADADLHVSISSATHYDALALGVPTVVLPLQTHETVQPLLDAGHAVLAADVSDLVRLIKTSIPRPEPGLGDYYCKTNAVDNTVYELRELGVHV